ncbi:MAG: hypothetical protein KGY70_11035 [Bacteroidales bacterium]|nr:hypothetical protein [Bacteroidales bacterium]
MAFPAIELGIVAYIALYLLYFLLLYFAGDLPLVFLIKGHLEKNDKDHNHNIFRKTGLRNRVQLVQIFGVASGEKSVL